MLFHKSVKYKIALTMKFVIGGFQNEDGSFTEGVGWFSNQGLTRWPYLKMIREK